MVKIILLDSNSLINRAFYAIPPMTTRDGVFTNAVYGYLSMLARLIAEHNPTHIGAVFDLKGPTFRHGIYDKYKATRKPMPMELVPQVDILKELLAEMNIKILQREGYEADDIIGTLGKRFDYDTIIVSGDRDVLQLVDHNTTVYNTRRGVTDIKIYNLESLAEEGFTPAQIIEYKALAGDSSDNIPGCPGVGEKTAVSLIKDYGDIDTLYSRIDEIKGKLKERLIENKELVYLSRRLASINTDVPIECSLEDLAFEGKIGQEFYDHLSRLECRSLIERFKKAAKGAPEEEKPQKIEVKAVFAPERVKIADKTELFGLLDGEIKQIAIDFSDKISFAFDTSKEFYIEPAVSLLDEGMSYDEALKCFKGVLEGGAVKVVFDIKTLMHRAAEYGISIGMPYEDILLKSYLIDVNRIPKDIKELTESCGMVESRAAAMLALNEVLDRRLAELDLEKLYRMIELPLIPVLFDMEKAGFRIDFAILNELSEKYTQEINELQARIWAIAGEQFNVNSPQQLSVILFEKLGLKPSRKTKGKTNYSVAAEILEELDHPIVSEILRYRMLTKLQSTYINGMRSVADPVTGRVHTVFRQCLTTTGRLSSNEPNLQNIPIRHEEGRNIRRMFVASPGNILITADYSQIELRLLAHFSGSTDLIKAYNSDTDIHALTASKIYEVPISEVTSEMRRAAKAVNFGIIYGISPFGLARNTGLTTQKAKDFIARYFLTYPGVLEYMDSNVEYAKKNGYIRSLSGRIRFFPELKSPNHNIRSFGERAALNMPLQGSAADIIKIAMLKVSRALKDGGYKAKLILQVHDELVIDTPLDEAEAVKKLLVENMESAAALKVPLVAEAKSGYDWYSVK